MLFEAVIDGGQAIPGEMGDFSRIPAELMHADVDPPFLYKKAGVAHIDG